MPAVVVGRVVVGVGVHRPQILGQRAQRRGQLLVGRLGRRPGGGPAVAGQRNGPQQRCFRDAVDERHVGVPAVGLVVARVDRQHRRARRQRRVRGRRRAQSACERKLAVVVEVVLVAEEDHLVLQERLVDRRDGLGRRGRLPAVRRQCGRRCGRPVSPRRRIQSPLHSDMRWLRRKRFGWPRSELRPR